MIRAHQARDHDLTLVSADRPGLAESLHRALVAVAETKGWPTAGGVKAARPANKSGRFVPSAPGE